MIKKMIKNCV